jgi:thiol-disulfide isomerase/thioredoxin
MSPLIIFAMLLFPADEGVKADFVPEGVTRKVGGYRPIRAQLDEKHGESVTKAPEGLENPRYGKIEFGDKEFVFILNEPAEGEPQLFVDSNADGDLTNDPAAEWQVVEQGASKMFNGSTIVNLDEQRQGKVNLYRFDPADERRAALKDTVLYYGDFGTEYTFTLDGQEFSSFVAGSISDGDRLWIDRDQNGSQSYNFEVVEIGKPFNYTGTTYAFAVADGQLTLDKSDKELPQAPMPPDLTIGKPALEFTAVTTAGDKINFPESYRGKLVMLDFWATWCGPCIGEIPNMKAAYEAHHDNGFEILGISFDQEDMEEKLKEFTEEREMPWPQIYEGKGWNTSLGEMHDVSGIPFVLLVDGDSGEILATAKELRGEGLSEFIGEMLEKKSDQQ